MNTRTVSRRPPRSWAARLTGATICAFAGLGGTSASAAVTCTYDPASLTLRVTMARELVGVERDPAGAISVFEEIRTEFDVKKVIHPCTRADAPSEEASPTVSNTDAIEVASAEGGTLLLAGSNGDFAPGATDEPGADEIEISVESQARVSLTLDLIGNAAAHTLELGREPTAGSDQLLANLNAGLETAAESDSDITVAHAGVVEIFTWTDADSLDARGGESFAAPLGVPISANLFGGDDRALVADGTQTFPPHNRVDGGSGADTIIGGAVDDSLSGGRGDDFVSGGGGSDYLSGSGALEPGADTLLGGDGNDAASVGPEDDLVDGGAGFDKVIYTDVGHTSPNARVTVDLRLQGVPQDTSAGGSDTLTGIESAFGTGGDDVLVGDSSRNLLLGLRGDDSLIGLGGDDRLVGWEGSDSIKGSRGADRLVGIGQDDSLTGSRGNDLLNGGRGSDSFLGGAGVDSLRARDETRDDRLACGPGPDQRERVVRDGVDPPPKSC
jgi:Ca2+-binding RTX toxin-like protein